MTQTRWVKGNLCGFLELEEGKNSFNRKYFELDKDADLLKIYFDHPNDLPKSACGPCEEIDLNFISKVSDARKMRPKAGLCFSITIAGDQMYLLAENEEELVLWINTLNEACKITVPPTTSRTVPCVQPNARHIVAGGVIVDLRGSDDETSEFVPPALSLPSIMSGYATKQGAVRKNWKKRYFVLDEKGLSYYKSEMERDPIKTISKDYIVKARYVDREHHAHREYLLELITQDRTFNVQCDTERACKLWITKINELVGHLPETQTEHHSEDGTIPMYCDVISSPEHKVLKPCNQSKSISTQPVYEQEITPRPTSQEEIEPNSKAVWV